MTAKGKHKNTSENKANCSLCSVVWATFLWLRKYEGMYCIFFSILSIYAIVWLEEKARMVRGGLGLKSFNINPCRLNILKF